MSRRSATGTAGALVGRERVAYLAAVARAQVVELPGLVRAFRGRGGGSAELHDPPSTALTRLAHELALDAESPALLGHSLRCWYLADLFAQVDRCSPDPEELYLACVLHDVGLTDAHRPPATAGCFAIHGGEVAAGRIEGWGGSSELASAVGHAIARHIDAEGDPSSASALLLQEAASCDVIGSRLDVLSRAALDELHRRHPRTGFTAALAEHLREEARLRPHSRAGLLWRGGMPLRLRLNPLDRWYPA